jgi:hypothetical protein
MTIIIGTVEFDFDLISNTQITPRQEEQTTNNIVAEYGPETGLYGIPFIVTPISPFNFDLSDFTLVPVPGYAWNIHFGETEPYAQPAPGTTVTLSLPVPDGYSADRLWLFHLRPDGSEEILRAVGTKTIDGTEYVQYELSSFSSYMLVEVEEDNSNSEDFTSWLVRILKWIVHYLFFGWLWG